MCDFIYMNYMLMHANISDELYYNVIQIEYKNMKHQPLTREWK